MIEDIGLDPTACPRCGQDSCDGACCISITAAPVASANGTPIDSKKRKPAFDPGLLVDATVLAAEGRNIAREGIRYLVDGLIPGYGMVGFVTAYAKVGKTTFGQALGASVARGRPFLDRTTSQARVLIIAAEDPREYTAYLMRHLDEDFPPKA